MHKKVFISVVICGALGFTASSALAAATKNTAVKTASTTKTKSVSKQLSLSAAPAKEPVNPEGTANAMAALLRFASGGKPLTPFDKKVDAALGKVKNARTIAERLVSSYKRMSSSNRSNALPDVTTELDFEPNRVKKRL